MPYKDRKKQREFQRLWMRSRREAYLRQAGPCVRCGTTEELEVDHIDPSQKISHRIWSWSRERREAELAKCQILCRICHDEKTREDMSERRRYRRRAA